MCKPKPGPRCSHHARQKLARARAAYARVEADPEASEDRERAAFERVKNAQDEYDTTPAGQQELRDAIADASGGHRERLEATLSQAIATRQREQDAYREKRRRDRDGSAGQDVHGARPDVDAGGNGLSSAQRVDGHDERREEAGTAGSVQPGGHRDGGEPRVLIHGQEVTPIRRVSPPAQRAAELRAMGVPTPDVYELSPQDAGKFRDAISALKEGNKFHASVHVYDEDEYKDMRLFVTDDGSSGFALHGDDVVSAFSTTGKHKGSARSMLATAVAQGGRRLDCFDTVLPKIYAQEGFVPVARVGWDDEYAPEGWDKETYAAYNGGEPDVVLMAYDSDSVEGRYTPGAGQRCDDYDTASELQQKYARAA